MNSFENEVLQTNSAVKDIPIKSNKTFLLEYWNLFFYIYTNKMIESFKNKNCNNYSKDLLKSLSLDILYKNKKNNFNESNINFMNKISSEYSISEQLNDKNEDKKKIISDNKIYDLYENNINEKLIHPKINMFSSSSLNNLGMEQYSPITPIMYDVMNRQQSGNLENMNNSIRFQTLHSTSFQNLNNRPPSLTNINLTPPRLNQRELINIYNNFKSSNPNLINNSNNNILPINSDIYTKKTLLSPPPPINNIPFQSLGKLTQSPILSSVNDKHINSFTFSKSMNMNEKNLIKDNEKNSSTLNMFNKKRKRDIKNNKLVFILGDNKKDKKEKEIKKFKSNETNQIKENLKKNDENLEKNRKPRGSKYRGVSRNGNQWQVLIMVNKKKRYVGSYSKEEDAARAYDKVALQNHGSKAKTNFDYTKKEVEEILASPQLLKLN